MHARSRSIAAKGESVEAHPAVAEVAEAVGASSIAVSLMVTVRAPTAAGPHVAQVRCVGCREGGNTHGDVKSASRITSERTLSGAKTTFQGVRDVLCCAWRWKKTRRHKLNMPQKLQQAVVAVGRGILSVVARLGAASSGCVSELMLSCGGRGRLLGFFYATERCAPSGPGVPREDDFAPET